MHCKKHRLLSTYEGCPACDLEGSPPPAKAAFIAYLEGWAACLEREGKAVCLFCDGLIYRQPLPATGQQLFGHTAPVCSGFEELMGKIQAKALGAGGRA